MNKKLIRWVLTATTALLFLVFLTSGAFKLAGAEPLTDMFTAFGLPLWFMFFTGVVEVACAIGLLFHKHLLGFVAAAGLMTTMIVAAGFHLVHDPVSKALPALFLAALAGLIAYHRRFLLRSQKR